MKLSQEQLAYAQDLVQKQNQVITNLGQLELEKARALNVYGQLEVAVEEFKTKVTEEFGEGLQINLDTGDLVKPVAEEKV